MALNRREFIGAMVASTSLGELGASVTPRTSSSATGQGAWLRNGMISGGNGNEAHETYMFIVRRGGQRTDAHQRSVTQQSEELIEQLHSQGIEVFHTHLYKGFGMAAEKEEMEHTRKAVAIAHRLGMKVDTYVQWGSMMYETFFAEEPRAEHWIQRDVAGQPIMLTYGYQQSFRYMPCFANQDYLDYLKKIVKYAIVEVKTDFIHFDNFGLNTEPDSCHCTWCVNGFRKFLRAKYSPAQLRDRFGFENISFVNPPLWNRDNPPDKMEIIYDPGFQEWADFRCQLMADALKQISEYMKSLNPEVAAEINPGGISGLNTMWASGVDHTRLLKSTEAFVSEENNMPAYHPDGRLVSRIRSYKLARIYKNVLLTPMKTPVGLPEGLAFNQTLGHVGGGPILADRQSYIDFYRKYREFYLDSEEVAPVAVFRSYASLTYHQAHVQLSTIQIEQTLIQSRTPFVLIFDEHLVDLAKYKVLILPNSECLSDEQLALIHRFVEGGGGLVVTEQAGLYDNWRRLRTQPGLGDLMDGQISGAEYQENVEEADEIIGGTASRKKIGAGRVAYIPTLEFDGIKPPAEPGFEITNRFWRRPKNWKDIVEDVRWAAGDAIPFFVDGPDFLVANYTYQPQNQRFLIHLVNYNMLNVPSLTNIPVRIKLASNKRPERVTLLSPEAQDPRALKFVNDDSGTRFIVPTMTSYALISVQL